MPAVADQPVAGAPGDVEDQLAPQSDEQSSAQAQQVRGHATGDAVVCVCVCVCVCVFVWCMWLSV